MKKLIINADDFGLSRKYNKEILKLIDKGYITSTTVMINRVTDDQKEDIDKLLGLEKKREISIGLHVEFTNDTNLQNDLQDQYRKFKNLFNQEPSHLDIHKSTFKEKGYPVIMKLCVKNQLPFRNLGLGDKEGKTTSLAKFTGTGAWLDNIVGYVDSIQNGKSGEILFHPGTYDPDSPTTLNREREFDVLKAQKTAQYAIKKGLTLTNFKNL